MSVNESDLPQFSAGPLSPIGNIVNPSGLPVAHKKQASGLLSRIMKHAKQTGKPGKTSSPKKSSIGKPGRRGIHADQKVHIGKKVKFY